MIWSYGLAVLAEPGPNFYQHLEVSDPDRRVIELRERGWTIRGYEPLPLEPPLDWAADPHADSNWQFQLNAMYPLAPVFQSLAVEYRRDWHDFAGAVFDDWISFNLDQDIDHPFRWNDMATGIRAAYLAQLIHHERNHGDPLALARYLDAARWHLQELADPQKLADSNHALFQLVGIAALCAVQAEASCAEALTYARDRYRKVFHRQFNEEGMHLEHSPEYHLLALRTFKKIEGSGLLRLGETERATLALAAGNLSLLMHPDGTFAAIGDTEPAKSAGAAELDLKAQWLLQEGKAGTPPDLGVQLFPATGYAIVRRQHASQGESYLFLTTAHHSRAHKHLDTGSFEWSDRGRRILVDSGKWGYDRSKERAYVQGLTAHNTVETEGVDYSPGDVPADKAVLGGFGSLEFYVVDAQMRLQRQLMDARFRRTIIGSPGEWLVVVDELTEMLPSTHTTWFHFAPDFSVQQRGGGVYEAHLADETGSLLVFPLFEVQDAGAFAGVAEPRMLGWHSPQYGVLQPNWQLGYRADGQRVRMATVFRWLDVDLELTVPTDVTGSLNSDGAYMLCWMEDERLEGVRLKYVKDDLKVAACE